MKNQIFMLSIDNVLPLFNTRTETTEQRDYRVSALQKSIESVGYFQSKPIEVMKAADFALVMPQVEIPEGINYVIIDGEGRYLAAFAAGLKEIPAIETDAVIETELDLYVTQLQSNQSTAATETDKYNFYLTYCKVTDKTLQSAKHFTETYSQFDAAFYTRCGYVATLPGDFQKHVQSGLITLTFAYEFLYLERFNHYGQNKKMYTTNKSIVDSGKMYKSIANKVLRSFASFFDANTRQGSVTAVVFSQRFSEELKTMKDADTYFIDFEKSEKAKGNKGTIAKEADKAIKLIASAEIDALNARINELIALVNKYDKDTDGNIITDFYTVPELVQVRDELKKLVPPAEVKQKVTVAYRKFIAPTEQEKADEAAAREAKKIAEAAAKEEKEKAAAREAVKQAAIELKRALHLIHGYKSMFEKNETQTDKTVYVAKVLTHPAGVATTKTSDALDIFKEICDLSQDLINTAAITTSKPATEPTDEDKL